MSTPQTSPSPCIAGNESKAPKFCAWTPNHDLDWDHWVTGCDQAFVFLDGGPRENQMRFCCYCGGALKVRTR